MNHYFFWSLLFPVLLVATDFPEPNFTIQIPMRDGLELPTDIYLPDNQPHHHPCVLVRSPAGRKAFFARYYLQLVPKGYVVAIQDTRNVLDLEGKTFPYWTDGWGDLQDGYDTVEWLANSAFSNGKIGTAGVSALGITQLMMAPSAPPSLCCQHIGVAAASIYHHALFPGGQLLKDQVEGWLYRYAWDHGILNMIHGQPYYNEFWSHLNSLEVADQVKVPAVHQGGWYDIFLQGTIEAFLTRQTKGGEGAKGRQKLLIGPWTHYWPKETSLGDFVVPKEGYLPPVDLSLGHWFDIHLKGNGKAADELPPVTYYVMGPFDGTPSKGNVWKTAESWPIPHTIKPLFLRSDGKLVAQNQPFENDVVEYRYDPHDPVPTVGGRNLFMESGPKDQSPIETRKDMVLFTSEPLKEDLEVTGELKVKLFLSSTHEDTDIVVRLTDVYPDGRSILIADGIYRTGLQNCLNEIRCQEPQEIEVDLWSTSMVFAKGHRIRVSVTSSNYPRYEKNHNVGVLGSHLGASEVAMNRIHMGGQYASRILLPVIE